MTLRHWEQIQRAAVAVGVLCFGAVGCSRNSAPDVPAKPAAQAAPAVTGAANEGKKPDTPAVIANPDAALAARVKAALAADERLKKFGIDVRAANRVVELFGTVDAKATRDRVAWVAAGVDGVKAVTNHLVLLSGS
jgi:osmotically-inducible protein OsmY